MKQSILIMIILCLSDICTKAQTIEPQVSENVELMSILSRTAGFPEYSMNLAGQYTADIDSCFRKYDSHPAVLQMKEFPMDAGTRAVTPQIPGQSFPIPHAGNILSPDHPIL